MECKLNSATFAPDPPCELIDTLWNVNDNLLYAYVSCIFELIDTLWNVNDSSGKMYTFREMELIDTLWNVNFFISH